jgi:eukaryotic-like serine/threonine-protein kinase
MPMDTDRWQRLQNLFHAAYELEEPERSRFLSDACGSDPVLLGQVEMLLSHQEDAKTFIESPALEVAGAALAEHALESGAALDLVGTTVAHYLVLEKLGAGGMGVVYKAKDTSLGRFVALKFLPHVEPLWPADSFSESDASDNSQAKRFLREAQAASALDHPNICTIYEVGQYKSAPFIAMQFLEGRTLNEEIDGKPCSLERILQVGIQVADALRAAHEAGIIHRDIKPGNIFALTGRPETKILDFGVASVLPVPRGAVGTKGGAQLPDAARGGFLEADSEHTTAVAGTLAYMSPEQVRGEEVDARSDLFSLGATLYEMANGGVPVAEKTSQTIFDPILRETPPVSRLNPQIRRALSQIISKAMHQDRDLRYQSAAELHDSLLRLKQTWASSNESTRLPRSWPVLVAVLLVAISLAAYRYAPWRQSHRLNQNDMLVLGDFSNTTDDPVFNETLKQALRVQLEQSPFLHVLSDQQVGQQLKYMRRPEDQPLTGAIAQEVCTRSGANILLTGSISHLENHYVLGINATQCPSGNALASEQTSLASRNEVLHGLVALSTGLRKKLGESPASINKYDAPIEQATTSSLEALQSYSLGGRTWYTKGEEAAIPFLARATELDPDFAMAWARLGVAYDNLGQDASSTPALSKAYASREKVSEPERLYIESRYYGIVTNEYQKALQVDELWQQIYPRDISPYLDAANDYATAGQHLKSLEAETQALQLEPGNGFIYANLAFIDINLNQFVEAQQVLDAAQERNIYNPWFESVRYQLGFLKHDPAQMQRAVAAVANQPSRRSFFFALQADTEAYLGHLTRARELTGTAVDSARNNKDQDRASGYKIAGILREAEFGVRRRALNEAHAVLTEHLSEQSRVLAALALARAGDSASALAIAEELNREHPSDTLLNTYWLPTIRAAVGLNRHNPSAAIKLLDPVIPYEMGIQPNPTFLVPYPPYLRGIAYLENGQGAEAAAEFKKITDHAGLVLNCPLGALASLELGRAYALEAGLLPTKDEIKHRTQPELTQSRQQLDALDKARKSYENFLALWKDADPDIPILREARAEYATLP